MLFSIKVDIEDHVTEALKRFSYTQQTEVDHAIRDSVYLLEAEVKKKLSRGGRGGRLYKNGRSQRSAPGEPPKTDSGRLVGSISHSFSFLYAEVGAGVHYAGYLELGTSKMAARPYLAPTLAENEDKIKNLIEQALMRAMR